MALLFDTPGLKAPVEPVASQSSAGSSSKKRKRTPSSEVVAKEAGLEINLQKLMRPMRMLDGDRKGVDGDVPRNKKSKKNKSASSAGEGGQQGPPRERKPDPLVPSSKHTTTKPGPKAQSGPGAPPNRFQPAKKEKGKKPKLSDWSPASSTNLTTPSFGRVPPNVPPHFEPSKPTVRHGAPASGDEDEATSARPPQTAMQTALRAKLAGGRFRMLNETLYTSTGAEAWETMKDEGAFDEYHAGFRSQSAHWPTHPLNLLKDQLSSRPAGALIADFGCGDATLARALVPRGLGVISFDLVSKDGWVVEAECSSVPLPGGKQGGQIVDVVVCCLSLMGTDWVEMVREARRVLKAGGELKVAEVTSRFTDVDGFVALIESVGFEFVSKDDSSSHFMMFEFVKAAEGEDPKKKAEVTKKASGLLRACVYKKREGK